MAPVAPKQQTRRRQTCPAEATAMLLVAQRGDNALVLEALMDLSSHMLVTKEFIT